MPGFCLTRLNHRLNTMTCENPCPNCSCEETVYNSSYQELDSSPMANQQSTYFQKLERRADELLKDLFAE